MNPISFPQQNNVLGKPENMTDEQCSGLPCHHYINEHEQPSILSCWQLTPEELAEVQRTGKVWVVTLGVTLAPFVLFVENPFPEAQTAEVVSERHFIM